MVVHYGTTPSPNASRIHGDLTGPLCGRAPKWAKMTNLLADVSCKWCLKKNPGSERVQVGSTVRLKSTVGGVSRAGRKQTAVVHRIYLGGTVFLLPAIDNCLCWNIDKLEVVPPETKGIKMMNQRKTAPATPEPFSPDWHAQQWGRIVIGIGAGRGVDVLSLILNEVALDRYDAGRKAAEAQIRTREKAARK